MHGFADRGLDAPRGRFASTGRFGRMFPELRSLRDFAPGPAELGRVGGAMDGGNPPPTDTSQNNPRIKAGYTFLGQFIDHDLTLDATSILEQQVDVNATHNFRTPALELDSVYGLGPAVQPFLYDRTNPFHLLVSEDGGDLPRNRQGTAIIGDPRNDENVIVSQLHLLFLKFHNKVLDDHTDPALGGRERFEAAQKLVRWHYQWIVLHEFLARTVGSHLVQRAVADPAFLYPGEPFMPVEFSVAAYRLGHSQVRPGYLMGPDRAAALFPDDPSAQEAVTDLRGGRPVPPELRIDWQAFFGPDAQPSKFLDTRISTVLLRLPDGVVPPGTPDAFRSLATRNLQRGLDLRLPSGQDVAAYLCQPALGEAELWEGVQGGHGPAPLWFYILREAERRAGGQRLAGVGAEIVARTFVALLLADRASFLAQDPGWTPTLPASHAGRFTMTDLVNLTLGTTLESEDVSALPGDDATPAEPPAHKRWQWPGGNGQRNRAA
ncbi:peroxidase family protein [Geminicoccus flavidas]|uniref:peroxidase family protein n=1 Tax=Geminicoccus flavidas TaxID=2506407 RepID=UPI00135887D1|nr:heme peroxidase family protein [Geminicoccus flavidas]